MRLKSTVEIGHVVYIFSSTLKISHRIFNRQLSVSISVSVIHSFKVTTRASGFFTNFYFAQLPLEPDYRVLVHFGWDRILFLLTYMKKMMIVSYM
ncbi:hypothetical protein HanRHA438_Chr09g0388881 [Helianthus annuus]|nr:hypothetical protein HanIR_Chr09g0406681 [Helianthus annuus]KAJ0541602.1 hypothetical protein HanHA89_Chr09g0330371 [Helianthus annuus]KAJ0706676.1 hypothetical protein HanLR1_Chr09g0309801 [Helianthus annuus]KAJ0887269.1 hypothetical protein HanRHA438_Chr09g0388881 [Helianthus annuus]